ncbi:MAG: hypothetical protein KDH17_21750 [Rhodocyclaceae bacterium]|nr:hypothetical protein [Rhodocyclaceae bacterium]
MAVIGADDVIHDGQSDAVAGDGFVGANTRAATSKKQTPVNGKTSAKRHANEWFMTMVE